MLKRIALLGLISFACGVNAMQEYIKNTKDNILAENGKLVSAINYYVEQQFALPKQLQISLHAQVEQTNILLKYYPENLEINTSFNSLQNSLGKVLAMLKDKFENRIKNIKEQLELAKIEANSAPSRIRHYQDEALGCLEELKKGSLQLDLSELKKQKIEVTKEELTEAMRNSIYHHTNNADTKITTLKTDIDNAFNQLNSLNRELRKLQ